LHSLAEFKYRELVTSSPDQFAIEAAAMMEDKKVGCVLVVSNDKILGIATRYDFIHHLIVLGKDARKTKIRDIMHHSPVMIDSSLTAADALRRMIERRVERLVVVSSSRTEDVLGVLSLEDIVAKLEATDALSALSKERAEQLRDMIKRLTPYLVARYVGDEKAELERDMNDEVTALFRLLEEAEVSLR
jgi:CBS domain-containing protein